MKKPLEVIADEAASSPPKIGSRGKALVFVSHDSRDADLAEAFANLLSDVSGGTLKSFRSSDKKGGSGLEFGAEWYKAIMSQLGDATDVVALLTQHSVDRPWILYEAGVAKGKLDTNVLGIALGVPLEQVSTGPFGQFQNCDGDIESLTKLVLQLMARNPDASPREAAVRKQVDSFLVSIKAIISTGAKQTSKQTPDETGIAKLFEEIKVIVREVPERVGERVSSLTRKATSRPFRRFHPGMLEELLFESESARSGSDEGRAIQWLIFISLLRDDFPWIYEVGIELYRAMRAGNRKGVVEARRTLRAVLKATSDSRIFHETIGIEKEEAYFMYRHLPDIVDRFVERSLERSLARSVSLEVVDRSTPQKA